MKLSLPQLRQLLHNLREQAPTESIEDYANRVWLSLPRIEYADLPKSLKQTVREVYTPETLLPFLLDLHGVDDVAEIEWRAGPGGNLNKAIEKAIRCANYTIELRSLQESEYRVSRISESHTMLAKDGEPFPVLYAAQFLDAFRKVTQPTEAPEPQRTEQQQAPAQDIGTLSHMPVVQKMPTSPLTFMLARVLNAGPAGPQPSRINRHEKIEILHSSEQNATQFTRKNKGQEYTVTVYDPEHTLKGGGKALGKLFIYMLQRWAIAGYRREFTFPLQDMIDKGIYKSIDTARRGVKTFRGRQGLISLSQMITTGRGENKKKTNTGGVMFYNIEITNNDVTVSVNDKMPLTLLANFFTMFPLFAYGLSTNAFWIVHYIMYLARQNGDTLEANKGKFTISIEAVRQYLELPAPKDVTNYKYYERIREPIETALEEIEEAIRQAQQAGQDFSMTITPRYENDSSIGAWLDGDLLIEMPPEQAARFIEIAKKEDDYARQQERDRQKAIAAANAKEAVKAAKKA